MNRCDGLQLSNAIQEDLQVLRFNSITYKIDEIISIINKDFKDVYEPNIPHHYDPKKMGNTFAKIDFAFFNYLKSKNKDIQKNTYYNKNNIGYIQKIMVTQQQNQDRKNKWGEDKIKERIQDLWGVPYYLIKYETISFKNSNDMNDDEKKKKISKVLLNCYNNIHHYNSGVHHILHHNEITEPDQQDVFFDNKCVITKCGSLLVIIGLLNHHLTTNDNTNCDIPLTDVFKYLTYSNNYKQLISHYHHLIDIHLSNGTKEEISNNFAFIHNKMIENGVICTLSDCNAFIRNSRDREIVNTDEKKEYDDTDLELIFLTDLVDSIHVYFLHSFDIGFRPQIYTKDDNDLSKDDQNENKNDEKQNNVCVCGELFIIKEARRCYGGGAVMCDGCEVVLRNDDIVYHCPNGKTDKHCNGYDLCKNCAIKCYCDKDDFIDLELKHLSEYLKDKKIVIRKARNINTENNKFMTNASNKNELLTDLLNNDLVKLLNSKQLNQWKLYLKNAQYDSDSIRFDIANINESESNIYKQFNNSIIFNTIKSFCEKSDIQYGWGYRFYYWPYFKDKDKINSFEKSTFRYIGNRIPSNEQPRNLYITKKYSTLKNEILSKQTMSIDLFNETYFKAKTLLHQSKTLKTIKSTYCVDNNFNEYSDEYYYDIDLLSPLLIAHICCLLFYCNFSKLSYNFSCSFRKIMKNESLSSVKKRNSSWAHMSKYLRELVECFGDPIWKAKDEIFYHGVSNVVYDKFIANFNGPTSTTKQLSVAVIFSTDNGLILELKKYRFWGEGLRYFNCSLLSAFNNEDERLFFGGQQKLEFNTIRILEQKQNLYYFIHALSILHKLINGQKPRYKTNKDGSMIRKLFSPSPNKHKYIDKCFKAFCNEKKIIKLSMWYLWMYGFSDSSYFLSTLDVPNLLSFSKIATIFPNVTQIHCVCADYIQGHFLFSEPSSFSSSIINASYIKGLISEIDKINTNKKTKLNTIYISTYGTTIDINLDVSLFSSTWQIERGFVSIVCKKPGTILDDHAPDIGIFKLMPDDMKRTFKFPTAFSYR